MEGRPGIGLSTIGPQDADLEFVFGRTSTFNTHLNQLTHTFVVETRVWPAAEKFLILITWEDAEANHRGILRSQFEQGRWFAKAKNSA